MIFLLSNILFILTIFLFKIGLIPLGALWVTASTSSIIYLLIDGAKDTYSKTSKSLDELLKAKKDKGLEMAYYSMHRHMTSCLSDVTFLMQLLVLSSLAFILYGQGDMGILVSIIITLFAFRSSILHYNALITSQNIEEVIKRTSD